MNELFLTMRLLHGLTGTCAMAVVLSNAHVWCYVGDLPVSTNLSGKLGDTSSLLRQKSRLLRVRTLSPAFKK